MLVSHKQVGRAARQGRSGAAFNLVDSEEIAYMVDLHLFLGRHLSNVYKSEGYEGYKLEEMTPDMVHYGGFPQHLLDEENESLRLLMESNGGVLASLWKVCENGMKQYRRTRPDPSKNAIRRAKELNLDHVHPLLLGSNPSRIAGRYAWAWMAMHKSMTDLLCLPVPISLGGSVQDMKAKDDMVKMLQGFRPQQTILEVQKSDGGSLYKGLTTGRGKKGPKVSKAYQYQGGCLCS